MEIVAIGTPCYGGVVTSGYASSLAASSSVFHDAGIKLLPIFLPSLSLVTSARNCVFHEALKRKVDSLVWIDADIEWEPKDLLRLCRFNLDVVGATYRQKRFDSTQFVFRMMKGKHKPDENGLLEVNGLGTGFFRVSRKAMLAVSEKEVSYTDGAHQMKNVFETAIIDGSLFSEDYLFCKKLKKAGFSIMLDTTINLVHQGTIGYRADFSTYLKGLGENGESRIN